ncbi:TPA: hypothetical protein U2C71_002192 [Streptococcus suis]|nr:hypothetical protein [Streptococcus suis]
MTFEYTDEQLNKLNWDKNVYSVNKDFSNRNKTKQIVKEPKNSNQKNIIEISSQQFQVVDTKVDSKTGFDGMAVAPIVNGKPDNNSVAVIVAGSDPNAKDIGISRIHVDPIGNLKDSEYKTSRDLITAGIATFSKSGSPQYSVLDGWIDELQNKEDYNIIKLSGYSQGSYVIKAGAKYGIPTTTFNAWFRYSSLTVEEQEFIRTHPELFIDYRRRKDSVVAWNDSNDPYITGYDDSFGTIRWLDGDDHDIKAWEDDLDSNTGRVIDPKTGRPLVETTISALQSHFWAMQSFKGLQSKWSTNNFSFGGEEQFLEVAQSYVIGKSMAGAAKAGLDELTSLKTKADAEVGTIWSKVDFSIYSELSTWEVRDIFASHGVTHQEIVSDFHDYTQKKVKKMEKLSTTFDTLKTKLDEAVESKKALDGELAGEFSAWHESL